mmetsp:Transcript_4857/g.7115  ORF Transcript_4857/g.7115 Transcript_4857/m.7115 type:complete len:275 (+) Transcript_4857:169-993(+)
MAPTLCGNIVKSKRTFLALGWAIVNVLAFLAFITTLLVTLTVNRNIRNRDGQDQYYNNNNNNGNEEDDQRQMEISVTSRAMAFTSLWIAVLTSIIGIYGTVVLGFVSPACLLGRIKYYWCCRNSVHKTTPMVLGAFMGGLLMYANLTLVCSVLFGEFKIRDYNEREGGQNEEGNDDNNNNRNEALSASSTSFSILCIFLTILYAGFSALVFTYSNDLIRENEEDERREALKPSDEEYTNGTVEGYIGNKFTVESTPRTTMETGYLVQKSDSSLE